MEIYTLKDGSKRYREMIRFNGQTKKSPSFKKISDAKNWKREMENKKAKLASFGSMAQPEIQLKDFLEIWIEKKLNIHNSPRTKENYMSDLKNHIKPEFEFTGIGFINHDRMATLVSKLKNKGLKPRTINKVINRTKTILNDAVRWEYLNKSPLHSFKELKVQDQPMRFLNEIEINQLLIASRGTTSHPIIVTALNGGLRLGEILALKPDRVNLNSGHFYVSRTLTRHGIQEQTKTHKARAIPMNDTLKALFTDLFRSQRSPEWMFTKENGKPFDINHYSQREFKKLLKKANLDTSIRFHDLRHTYSSHFVMNGGSIFDLQKILGHKDIKHTQIYSHLSQDYLKNAVQIINFDGGFNTHEPYMNHKSSLHNTEQLECSVFNMQ
jgi:integrase